MVETVVTTTKVGYFPETSYGVRVLNGSTWRRFGLETGVFEIPYEKTELVRKTVSSSYDPNDIVYANRKVEFGLEYVLVDPRELYYALGINSQGAEVGGYATPRTQTMTGMEPSSAFTLPSRTFHTEQAGITAKQMDIAGVLTTQLDLVLMAKDTRGIIAKESFLGQRYTDTACSSNLYGDTAASGGSSDVEGSDGYTASQPDSFVASTHLPSLRGGAASPNDVSNPKAFRLKNQGKDTANGVSIGGTDVTNVIKTIGIRITNKLNPVYVQRSGTNNYNVNISHYIMGAFLESRTYTVYMEAFPNSDIAALSDEISSGTLTKQVIVDFTRTDSDASTLINEIKFTFNATKSPVQEFSGKGTSHGIDDSFYALSFQPQTLVSCIAKSGASSGNRYIQTLLSDSYATTA